MSVLKEGMPEDNAAAWLSVDLAASRDLGVLSGFGLGQLDHSSSCPAARRRTRRGKFQFLSSQFDMVLIP